MVDVHGKAMEGPFRSCVIVRYVIKYDTMNLDGDFRNSIVIVAVNRETHEVYKGHLKYSGYRAGSKEGTSKEELDALKNSIVGGAFKVSLIEDLELPIKNAVYSIYATLGEYKSNVLTLTTEVK